MAKVLALGVSGPQETEVAVVAGADRSVQFNSAGQQSGAAQTEIDVDGNLLLTVDNAPIKPSVASKAVIHLRQRAMRTAPSWFDSNGTALSTQISFASNNVWFIGALQSGGTLASLNISPTTQSLNTVAVSASGAANDHITEKTRCALITTTVAGNMAYVHCTGGKSPFINTAITPASPSLGVARGFTAVFKINRAEASIVTAARLFAGMSAITLAPTNINPTTQLNTMGIYKDTADTNWKLFSSGSTAGVSIDLGVNFPCNTNTDCFELVLHSPTNSGRVFYEVVCTNTGATVSGEFAAANLPSTYQFLSPRMWVSNNTAAAVVNFQFQHMYGDSPR
jgi:hypothetical protein